MYQIKGQGSLESISEDIDRPLSETRTFKISLPNGDVYVLLFTPEGIHISYDRPVEILFDGGSLLITKSE